LDAERGGKDILLTGSRAVPVLASGESSINTNPVTVTVPGTTPAGTYYLFACADDTKVVAETSETNNCIAAQSTIVVLGPDLIESSVETYDSYVFRSGSFQVTDTVQNVGTEPAGASTTRYYLSSDAAIDAGDILLSGSRAVPALVAQATSTNTVTVTVPGTTPFGTYFVFACADYTKAVAETSETNNCELSPWVIEVMGPDLVEQSVSASETVVPRGGSFQVTDMAQNIGFEAAGTTSLTRYYLSLDYVKGPEDILLEGSRTVPALESNEISENTVTVTVPVTTPIGTYNLFACADDTGSVAETDELNNCFAPGQVPGTIEVQ